MPLNMPIADGSEVDFCETLPQAIIAVIAMRYSLFG